MTDMVNQLKSLYTLAMLQFYIILLLSLICVGNSFLLAKKLVRLTSSVHGSNVESPSSVRSCVFDGTGCVLLSKPGEFDHFLRKSAILIYEHNTRGTVGLIMGKASPFTMGEMAPNMGVFAPNVLYRGGSEGSDTAVMVHKHNLGGSSKPLGKGISVGGLKEGRSLVESMNASPKDFNFIFNNVQWAPGLLQSEIDTGRWDVCEVPPDVLLSSELHREGEEALWATLHNALNAAVK